MAWKTDEEMLALQEKLEKPSSIVICPSCGSEITYERKGNSEVVKCTGCGISGGTRGI